jgi:hypothetical protein
MKPYVLFLLCLTSFLAHGQEGEFKIHNNGLIYDEVTMARLGAIVDSLNLKFRSCDLSHPYYSFEQGLATQVKVPNKEARKLIESGVSWEAFQKRYPSRVEGQLWIVKRRYEDYKNNPILVYSGLPYGWSSEPSIQKEDTPKHDKTTGWVVSENGELAFYFSKLQRYTLPFEYARLVQYVDCMIDTTAKIYLPQVKGEVYQRTKPNTRAGDFMTWANSYPGKPKELDYKQVSDDDFDSLSDIHWNQYMEWDSLRRTYVEEQLKTSPERRRQLAESVEENILNGNSDNEFESYVARYVSRTQALQLKRSRRVIGNCSMDMSPRYHAMEICQLSAETAQWDIFLRSHLDIMNDRFERRSDGNYAWAGRKTYLKELEELNIPAIDLLLGTSLRVANVSDNHYWSSISRAGRALIDAADKEALEQRLISMIQDTNLDPYNRLLTAYLFSNYAGHLEDKSQRQASVKRLEGVVASMPEYMREVWKKE